MITITFAAVRCNGKIYTGLRHGVIMQEIWKEYLSKNANLPYIAQDAQGFTTSDGEFVNRFQAGTIAFDAGQTKTKKKTLMSEDLW